MFSCRYANALKFRYRFLCRSSQAFPIRHQQTAVQPPQAVTSSAAVILDFTNHKQAFKEKSLWDVTRALLVLGVCSSTTFSKNSAKIFDLTRRWLGTTLTSLLVKPLFYNQFVGGDTIPEVKNSISKMETAGSGTFVLMVMEAIEESEEAKLNHRKITEMMDGLAANTPTHGIYMQMRISALFTTRLLTDLSLLNVEDRERFIHSSADYMSTGNPESLKWLEDLLSISSLVSELKAGLEFLEDIGQRAVASGTVLMVDAEYTSTNPALTALSLALSLRCNTNRATVWNTIQCYLKSSFEAIQWEYNFATKNCLHFGVKLVRGAYMIPELNTAKLGSYPSPVHDGIPDTNSSYNSIVDWLLQNIQNNSNQGRQVRSVLASHNQESIRQAVERMEKYCIDNTDRKVIFAQIYGMCDHITYTLSQNGYPVYKSLPVGSVCESLPYLSRRSQENTSIIANSRQERQLLRSELFHRIKP